MRWADGFIAVDWGTTNRRGYRIAADGSLADEFADDLGILSVPKGDFPKAVATLTERLGDLPMLMAGMVGSNRGWREAPYVPCPAGLPEIAQKIEWVEPGRIGIVPGVCWSDGDAADVMRGEEVQILGAYAAGLVGPDATVCHPGTHNKLIRLEDGRITRFRTVMTGEMFNLLSEHSILSDLLSQPVHDGEAFEEGVRRGIEGEALTAEFFSVRARVLLGKAKAEDAASYTSGLLIGADIRTGLKLAGEGEIVAMGRPDLTALYGSALRLCGRTAREVDGEQAFLEGAKHLAELVQ